MKKAEKLNFLFDNHYAEYSKAWSQANDEVSDMVPMFCFCGKLCTGLHEMNCPKFMAKVKNEVLKKLDHLLP